MTTTTKMLMTTACFIGMTSIWGSEDIINDGLSSSGSLSQVKSSMLDTFTQTECIERTGDICEEEIQKTMLSTLCVSPFEDYVSEELHRIRLNYDKMIVLFEKNFDSYVSSGGGYTDNAFTRWDKINDLRKNKKKDIEEFCFTAARNYKEYRRIAIELIQTRREFPLDRGNAFDHPMSFKNVRKKENVSHA